MDIVVKNNEVQGIVTQNGDTILANKMILLGHSARDIFELLDRKNIHRSESFRFRGTEHPQSLIDSIQYSCDYRSFCLQRLIVS
jgi:uncharacterized FAD-dependent dehydrogenase